MHQSRTFNVGALKRTELARLLNQTRTAEIRRRSKRDKVTSNTTIGKWIDAGLPVNPNGSINLLEVCAWLVCERKESITVDGRLADEGKKSYMKLKKDLMQSQVEANNANTNWRKVKTELEEFKRRMQKGELVDASVIEKEEIAKAHYVRETLEDLVLYAGRLTGKRGQELREELEKIGREICIRLAGDA